MTDIWIESISLFAPGLNGWSNAEAVLKNQSHYDPKVMPALESRYLTPTNKRRTSPHMHIAVQAADYALRGTSVDEARIELIVTSSEPDLDIAESDMQALVLKDKEISPQKFQNVILNASAGHLGIFMKNISGSTTVSGSNNCFAVGLMQAYSSLLDCEEQVLLVAHDAPSTMPYGYKDRPFFGVGLLLNRSRTNQALAGLRPEFASPKKINPMNHSLLEEMRKNTPAAGCLSLLQAIAEKRDGRTELYYSDSLSLVVTVCF